MKLAGILCNEPEFHSVIRGHQNMDNSCYSVVLSKVVDDHSFNGSYKRYVCLFGWIFRERLHPCSLQLSVRALPSATRLRGIVYVSLTWAAAPN